MSVPPFPPWTPEAHALYERGLSILLTIQHEGMFWIRVSCRGLPTTTFSMLPDAARQLAKGLADYLETVS